MGCIWFEQGGQEILEYPEHDQLHTHHTSLLQYLDKENCLNDQWSTDFIGLSCKSEALVSLIIKSLKHHLATLFESWKSHAEEKGKIKTDESGYFHSETQENG